MGSFEKLGILVIVIIIVMILVVAIYQWGGAEFELAPEALRVPYTGPALVEGNLGRRSEPARHSHGIEQFRCTETPWTCGGS